MALDLDTFRVLMRGSCVFCYGPAERLDHVQPRHAGGLDFPENRAPLCDECNKVKSCFWPGHGYHPMAGYENSMTAESILLAELEYLESIYGEAPISSRAIIGKQRDAWRDRYMHLAEALQAELGERAFSHWNEAGRGPAWRIWIG